MEIQLFKALLAAGVNEEAAANLTEAMERDIRERISDARKELASKADVETIRREIAEAKTEIIKWNLASLIASAGLVLAVSKLLH